MTPGMVADLARNGMTDEQIGKLYGVNRQAVLRFRKKHGISGRPVGQNAKTVPPTTTESITHPVYFGPPPSQTFSSSLPLDLPPRPFAVPIPAPASVRPIRDVRRAVILPDTHIPFHDEGAVAVAEAVVKMVDPHVLVHIGDLLDAGKLSTKFPTDPRRIDTLQEDINTARVKLHQWAQLAPHARRVLLEGNHEERLRRVRWGMNGAERELVKLDDVHEALKWENLLRLKDIGWEWVGYEDQPRDDILPHLLVKHGTYVSAEAGMTAQREWKATGRSGVSGHTHRANVWRHRDWNGQATWVECGCLCDLNNTPGVSSTPNWQQAVTVIEWNGDGALMHVEQVLIRDGRAVFRGEEISA